MQGRLEAALAVRFQGAVRVAGTSRTDAGVHARGQLIHFDVPLRAPTPSTHDPAPAHPASESVPLAELAAAPFAGRGGLGGASSGFLSRRVEEHEWAVNALLPPAIRMRALERAPVSQCGRHVWSCMHNSVSKRYCYRWAIGPQPDPLDSRCRAHVRTSARAPFDLERVRRAAALFEGTHDWRSFTNLAYSGGSEAARAGKAITLARDHTRTLHSVAVVEEGSALGCLNVRLEFELDGALYKMVRNIVGTLTAVGYGKVDPEQIPELIARQDRSRLPGPAPAHGLTLESVAFTDEPTAKPGAEEEGDGDSG